MPALIFAAFTLISVPAYVAMFGSKDDLDDDETETDGTYTLSAKTAEELKATEQRSNPISGLFQIGRHKRVM